MKLEIGSGPNPTPGYLHCDINPAYPCVEYLCSAVKLPMESGTFDELLAVNVLEHIDWMNVKPALKEWVRVLKPGGIMTIHVPNINFISVIVDPASEEWNEGIGGQPGNADTDRWEYLNHYVMGTEAPFNMHKSVFNYKMLTEILESFGMGDFKRLYPESCRWLYIQAVKGGGK